MRESTFTLVYWGFIPSFPTKGQLVFWENVPCPNLLRKQNRNHISFQLSMRIIFSGIRDHLLGHDGTDEKSQNCSFQIHPQRIQGHLFIFIRDMLRFYLSGETCQNVSKWACLKIQGPKIKWVLAAIVATCGV